MIALKRNDKIIIIVAVLVLIVAAIGVAFYSSPKPTVVPPSTGTGTQEYTVTWTVKSDALQSITEFAGKKTPYTSTFQIPQGNLKSISFNLTWVDDHLTLLGRHGMDTLGLSIQIPDGDLIELSNQSARKTGEGTIEYELDATSGMPPTTPIQAPDLQSAQDQLMLPPYFNNQWMNKDFTITVSDHIGEIRPIPRLLDKGNNFELHITYSYYVGTLTPGSSSSDIKNTGTDTLPQDDSSSQSDAIPYMSMIIQTGCGRFI